MPAFFLPKSQSDAKAVAWKGLSIGNDQITPYGQALSDFFRERGFSLQEEPFFSHVAIAKISFKKDEWEAHFCPLPYQVKAIRLYEHGLSLKNVPI